MNQQLQTQFYAGPSWLATKRFPVEPFNPRDLPELVDKGFGGYWSEKDGPQKIKAIELARSTVASTEEQEVLQNFRELEKVTFSAVLEELDREVGSELGISKFADSCVMTLSENLIPKNQRTATFDIGPVRWTARRLTENSTKLPYVGQFSLDFSKRRGLPFSGFWIAEDRFLRHKLPAKPEERNDWMERLRAMGIELDHDPILLGEWSFNSSYKATALVILARWQNLGRS